MKDIVTEKQMLTAVAPYVASTYMTMCSVVLGVSFAALVYEFAIIIEQGMLNHYPTLFKFFIALALYALIWHRYATHTHLAVWRLGPVDTLVPIAFAFSHVLLAFTISGKLLYFSAMLSVIGLVGVGAYRNTVYRISKDETITIFDEHFENADISFARNLQDEMNLFQWQQCRLMLLVVVIFFFLSFIIWILDKNGTKDVYTYITCIVSLATIIYSFIFDLRHYLNNCETKQIRDIIW